MTVAAILLGIVASAQLSPVDLPQDTLSSLQLTVFDVGVGSAVLLETPNGEWLLVDGGPGEPLRFLQQLRVDSLSLVVASDASPAHVRGLRDVVTARPVGVFAHGAPTRSSDDWARLLAAVDRIEEIRPVPVDSVVTLEIGGVLVELLPDPAGARHGTVAVHVRFEDFSVFLPSMADATTQRRWLLDGHLRPSSIVVAPRHGARDGIDRTALRALAPEAVVVSASATQHAGGPDPAALTAYATHTDRIFRTDRDGHVTIVGYRDGTFDVSTQHGAPGATEATVPVDAGASVDVFDGALPYVSISVTPSGAVGREGLNGEYATIRNSGPSRVPIGAWTLCDLSTRCFRFPPGSVLEAGGLVRVYTGYGTTDGYTFFMNHTREVWNDNGDEATLRDGAGRVVARGVY